MRGEGWGSRELRMNEVRRDMSVGDNREVRGGERESRKRGGRSYNKGKFGEVEWRT